jgi:hypothetical protein
MNDRTVNRRPFLPIPVGAKKIDLLEAEPVEDTRTQFFTARSRIRDWARLIYLADQIRYSHPTIHSEVFSKILLSKQEAESRRMGLEIDRLGAGPIAKPLMWLIKPWERMSMLSRFGADSLLARHSQLMGLLSGGMCLITINSDEPELWVKAGEQTERLWVTAQRLGLCVHPMTVALYLGMRYRDAGLSDFLPAHRTILEEINKGLEELVTTGVGTMLFRFGRGIQMRNTSIRMPIDGFIAGS